MLFTMNSEFVASSISSDAIRADLNSAKEAYVVKTINGTPR